MFACLFLYLFNIFARCFHALLAEDAWLSKSSDKYFVSACLIHFVSLLLYSKYLQYLWSYLLVIAFYIVEFYVLHWFSRLWLSNVYLLPSFLTVPQWKTSVIYFSQSINKYLIQVILIFKKYIARSTPLCLSKLRMLIENTLKAPCPISESNLQNWSSSQYWHSRQFSWYVCMSLFMQFRISFSFMGSIICCMTDVSSLQS